MIENRIVLTIRIAEQQKQIRPGSDAVLIRRQLEQIRQRHRSGGKVAMKISVAQQRPDF